MQCIVAHHMELSGKMAGRDVHGLLVHGLAVSSRVTKEVVTVALLADDHFLFLILIQGAGVMAPGFFPEKPG